MALDEKYFGSPEKTREYKILFYLGLGLGSAGAPLTALGLFPGLDDGGIEALFVVGAVALFIGFLSAISGWLGLREERKKHGMKRTPTGEGKLALVFGLVSVLGFRTFPLPLSWGYRR